jgi:protein-S-isoprenylcysteine O-methyltransferase Ste14
MAFASRSYLPLFFAVLMSVFWGLLAAREEVFLKSEFGSEYENYKEEVPWRFIPGLY